jgi:Protein of unknown function (DUF3800)
MYVDDSGSPGLKDGTFYVITGVILHESIIRDFEKATQVYKRTHFREYANCEIHTHDIYKSKRDFSDLTLKRKYELLDSLYDFMLKLPITVISVGIEKVKFVKRYSIDYLFEDAWTFLVERFEQFINDNGQGSNEGMMIVDKSSKIPENEICKIVRRLRRIGTNFCEINHLVEEPMFIDSSIREGIQMADAAAYCTIKHLTNYVKFSSYWDILASKIRRGPTGQIEGYGFKVFP